MLALTIVLTSVIRAAGSPGLCAIDKVLVSVPAAASAPGRLVVNMRALGHCHKKTLVAKRLKKLRAHDML